MKIEQIAAILGDPTFTVGQRVAVYPQGDAYEPEQGIIGTIESVEVHDDWGSHPLEHVAEVDNERLGSVWYFAVAFDPNDPLLAESDPHGGYYIWELEAA